MVVGHSVLGLPAMLPSPKPPAFKRWHGEARSIGASMVTQEHFFGLRRRVHGPSKKKDFQPVGRVPHAARNGSLGSWPIAWSLAVLDPR